MSLTVFDFNDMRLYSPIANVFGINQKEYEIIDRVKENAWKRCMFCFDHINNDKFNTGGCQIVVPFGETMDFDLIWDGYDLVSQLTRVVAVR